MLERLGGVSYFVRGGKVNPCKANIMQRHVQRRVTEHGAEYFGPPIADLGSPRCVATYAGSREFQLSHSGDVASPSSSQDLPRFQEPRRVNLFVGFRYVDARYPRVV